MPTRTKAILLATAVLLLAGCAGSTVGGDSPALTNVTVESEYGNAVIEYNQTSETASIVELEGPSGEVIKQKEVSGYLRQNVDISREGAGEYTLRLKDDGQTVDTQTVTVEKAQPAVNITAHWDQAALPQALIEVRNEGDLATNASVQISHAGEQIGNSYKQPLAGGENYTFRITGGFGPLYQATDGGTVNLETKIETDNETVTRMISHEVEPANLEFEYMQPNWQSNELKTVDHVVRNTGDVTAELDGELTVNGQTAVGSLYGEVEGGQANNFTIDHADLIGQDWLYKADSGSSTVDLTLRYKGGEISTTATSEFEAADAEISDVTPSWTTDVETNDSQLNSVDFTVRNTGEVDLTYDGVQVEIEGQTDSDDPYQAATIGPGGQTTVSVRFGYNDGPLVSPGDHDMTITLFNGGRKASETTTTVTAGR